MSHGITTNDEMFSVRRAPWHGLGVVLEEYPRSIDGRTRQGRSRLEGHARRRPGGQGTKMSR